jgi:hypothetical protein
VIPLSSPRQRPRPTAHNDRALCKAINNNAVVTPALMHPVERRSDRSKMGRNT